MSAADWLSIAVVLVAAYAMHSQFQIMKRDLRPRRFAQVIMLLYFVIINLMALTTSDNYLLRSGILSKAGVIILLITIILDKGE